MGSLFPPSHLCYSPTLPQWLVCFCFHFAPEICEYTVEQLPQVEKLQEEGSCVVQQHAKSRETKSSLYTPWTICTQTMLSPVEALHPTPPATGEQWEIPQGYQGVCMAFPHQGVGAFETQNGKFHSPHLSLWWGFAPTPA